MKLSFSRILLVIFLVLLAVGSIIAFIILNHSAKPLTSNEKEAALENILGRKPVFHGQATGNVEYKGKYLSFMYPARARIYKFSNKEVYEKPNLEVFSFDLQDPKLILNLTVSENLANLASASEISGAMLREDPSRGFTKTEIIASGQKGIAFDKNGDAPEKTGFFMVSNRLYSIAITGGDYKEVVSLFDEVIKSLSFN